MVVVVIPGHIESHRPRAQPVESIRVGDLSVCPHQTAAVEEAVEAIILMMIMTFRGIIRTRLSATRGDSLVLTVPGDPNTRKMMT